jgi:hypothetical protein
VKDHLPESEREWVDLKLVRALSNPDAAAGLRDAKALATALERKHPGAAASLREGLPELFTVARLGITGTLAATLTSSNPIESMISIARATNRNVSRWRDGQMVLRWTAAGMVNAQRSFRRVKGYKQMPQLMGTKANVALPRPPTLDQHAPPPAQHRSVDSHEIAPSTRRPRGPLCSVIPYRLGSERGLVVRIAAPSS